MSTEIFATFGPACRDEAVLRNMVAVGLTGMRLNLSHMTLPEAADYINVYKNVTDSPKILIDMQGPELRVGKADITLEGTVDINRIGLPTVVINALEAGDELLLDDGKLLLKMTDTHNAEVLRGGFLKSRKSVKIKNKNIDMPVLTDHDIENIRLARDYSVSAVMQPFVRSGDDLKRVREILDRNGGEHIKIYAKIENRTGVENICDILPYCDVLVIARGDLGNDMPLWELPAVQKQIERACHKADKPYIVVTQMLQSMEHSPVPTRAEVSDIYHAVYHGAWGVMITAESAVGKYPVEAVKYLSKTAEVAENEKKQKSES
ncbi:MAG: pyruvate kinase [Clostridia bacterium]|nr:pyruvate kinase [Clostridia bacterium]